MIYFFTGVPGSGKSYHLACVIKKALKENKFVISNFNVNTSNKNFIYVENNDLNNNAIKMGGGFSNTLGLINFARNFHNKTIKNNEIYFPEHQTILVLDECHIFFDSRKWNRADRTSWVEFFAEHRKFGYDIYLTSQDDKSIDKQIKARFENEIYHRKFLNFIRPPFDSLLRKILKREIFIVITRKYGMASKKQAHIKTDYIISNQKIYDFYNSSHIFMNLNNDFIGCNNIVSNDEAWEECVTLLKNGFFAK